LNDPADSPDAELESMMVKLRNRYPAVHEETTFQFVRKVLEASARPGGPFDELITEINRLREQYHEALDALKQIGVTVRKDHGQQTLLLDFSAFNSDLMRLAEAMYLLGTNRAAADTTIDFAHGEIKQYHTSLKGGTEKTSNAAAAKKAVRNELAQLLSESNTNERTDAALAKQIVPRLAGSVRREYSTVRKFLAELKMEIIELANEGDISRLDPESKVVAILERRRGEPGYTAKTVRWTLAIKD